MQAGFALASRGRMVFEYIIRHSPRRRASPWLAEGFSPTARAVERIKFSISISPTAHAVERNIAVLRYIDPWLGLPCRARRHFQRRVWGHGMPCPLRRRLEVAREALVSSDGCSPV